jgi:hypothetical protein
VSNEQLRLTTEEERERLHAARRQGGLCAACGRELGAGETVYRERIAIVIDRSVGVGMSHYSTVAQAPVGVECASPELLRHVEGTEPERCAGCGRGVYYRSRSSTRRQAICSKLCNSRAVADRRKRRPA